MLNEISPLVKDVLIKLAGSKFNRTNPNRVQEYVNEEVHLNDSNLAEYLSELEEYTNAVLIYKGKASKQSNADIYAKTLLLEELPPKEFKKRAYVHLLQFRITVCSTMCWKMPVIRQRESRSCLTVTSWRNWPRRISNPANRQSRPTNRRRNDLANQYTDP